MDAIRTEGLTKKYKDVVAVDHLDLVVNRGEILSLLGVNGAGKTRKESVPDAVYASPYL